ncbi:MAG: hypothetical protein ACKO2L_17405 [Planctomycetaceae bacterium]
MHSWCLPRFLRRRWLLLARLQETAGFAEDGQLGAAATAWKSADELARQLQKRNLLDERLR